MNFMFEWQEQYLTSERSERVRYCSCHDNIKFISSSQRVMFFLLYGDEILKISHFIVFQSSQVLLIRLGFVKGGNRDVIERLIPKSHHFLP